MKPAHPGRVPLGLLVSATVLASGLWAAEVVRPDVPTADERAALPARQAEFRRLHRDVTVAVFPVRLGSAADAGRASELADSLSRAGIGRVCAVTAPMPSAATIPAVAEHATPWNLARAFRAHLRGNPCGADYAILVDASGAEGVDFVLCDARGDWVLVGSRDFPPVAPRAWTGLVVDALLDLVNRAPPQPPPL